MPGRTVASVRNDKPSLAVLATVNKIACNDHNMCNILGVEITDITRQQAAALFDEMIDGYTGRSRCVFFANAHTLNLATADAGYRHVLNSAECVFGDGTGVRWAARINGTPVFDNVNGTDLLPEYLRAATGRRYYLLGADVSTISKAAAAAKKRFPSAELVGFHHGYLPRPETAPTGNVSVGRSVLQQSPPQPSASSESSRGLIERINAARPHILLVGMGNPLQEEWISAHRRELKVPLIVGVGGLFDFWAGNFSRAPRWLRKMGHEWLWRLSLQPVAKGRRYLLGNPLFLYRVLRRKFA